MAITVSDKDLGSVTAYAYAVSKGYTGTEEEYAELMASYADVAEDAAESASNSEAYAVGTRDGDDVESSDPAYHNNSKYYAEQAANAAESILPYTELSNDVSDLKSALNFNKTATAGYILTATNDSDGSTWSPVGLPTDAQTALAVSDWLSAHPEATTTVQDGSITEEKLNLTTKQNLTNTVNVFNVLNYSVNPRNTGNQAPAINAVIALCEDRDTVYLPNGRYRITEPIIINKSINFICDGEIRAVLGASGYAIQIQKEFVNVWIRSMTLNNSNSGGVQLYSATDAIRFVKLHIDYIGASSASGANTINITANEKSVYSCIISGKWFYGATNSNCISVTKLSPGQTIGEIRIYDVNIGHYNYAAYVADDNLLFNDGGNVNSIQFINCQIEGNNNGFYFKNTRSPVVLNCRIAEQQASSLFTFDGFVLQGFYCGRTPIKLIGIKFVNPVPLSELIPYANFKHFFCINGPCYFADNDAVPKDMALIDGGKIYYHEITLNEYVGV